MRTLDRMTINSGTPGAVLMERAGFGAASEILEFAAAFHARHVKRIVIIAGKGNNGGDGFVIARRLYEIASYPVTVWLVCNPDALDGDARDQFKRLPGAVTVEQLQHDETAPFQRSDIVIDCLLGTGINGTVREPFATMIHRINEAQLPVVAIDVPSGLDADTGAAAGVAVRADLTITIGLPKTGLFTADGIVLRGRVRLVDIDIPASFIHEADSAFDSVFADDVCRSLRRLPAAHHKGDMGRILIVGGSCLYPGAPMLAGSGALRSGGGLVTVAYPASIGPLLRPHERALILRPIEDAGSGYHRKPDNETVANLIDDQDVVVVGPGLAAQPESAELVQHLLNTRKTMVLDADALAVLGKPHAVLPRPALTVITPHPGEMRRILAAAKMGIHNDDDRVAVAVAVANAFGAFVVLKGPATIVAAPDGRYSLNTTGTAALASGGTGDVLAGMIAAFLCQIDDPFAAVQTAVFLHGLAAELAPGGMRTFVADDLPATIGRAMSLVSPFA